MSELYYKPPTDEQFNEVKRKAKALWFEVDSDNDEYGYASGKCADIANIKNVQDNFMYMVAMFDIDNQRKLADKLSKETKKAISDRMIDGGQPNEYNPFL